MGPAFRFYPLLAPKEKNDNTKNTILLCLPLHIDDSREIIQLAFDTDLGSSYRFIIKPHPQQTIKQIKNKIIISNNQKFVFSEDLLYDLFKSSIAVITTASSTCLEAIFFELKVIIAGSKNNFTKNNLNTIIDNDNWSVCYNPEEVKAFIKSKKPLKKYTTENFFHEVNKDTVEKFLS